MPETCGVADTAPEAAAPTARRRPLADVGAVALLGAVLLWLPVVSGGRTNSGVAGVGLIAVVAAPAAYHGLIGTSRTERVLLSALGVALLVHPFVAGYRDAVDGAMLRYASVPMIYLTARYAAVRWPRTLPIAVPLSGLWIWSRGWSGWMDPPETIFAAWRVVPWHNPSGILLGAFAVYAGTVLLAGRRRWLHAVVATVCLSGLWLSASRASIAMTALALVVVAAVQLRDRAGALWLGGAVASATLVTVGLLTVSPSYGVDGVAVLEGSQEVASGVETPFGARGGAAGNARARVLHVQTALRMFEQSPVTGTGLGSYDYYVLDLAEPRMNFTRSAHSEPFEVLGEGGLLVGVPFTVLTLAAGVVLLPLVLRRRWDVTRRAAAAAAGLVLAHTLFDVDWAYLLVLAFAAVAAGMARAERIDGTPGRWPGARLATVLALVLPIVLGLVLMAERSVAEDGDRAGWWEARPHVDRAVEALADARLEEARAAAVGARAAAPGDPATAELLDVVTRAQRGEAEVLYELATDPDTLLRVARFAVAALVGIDPSLAIQAADELQPRLDAYHPERVAVFVDDLDELLEPATDQRSSAS